MTNTTEQEQPIALADAVVERACIAVHGERPQWLDGTPTQDTLVFKQMKRSLESVWPTVELQELHRLRALINSPEVDAFLRGTHVEAVHQVERWGTAHDRAKRPADWFWLVGYLAGKALHAATEGDAEKAKHHCISTAAALYNWHCAISGLDTRMCPGRSDLAEIVDQAFPGEVSP